MRTFGKYLALIFTVMIATSSMAMLVAKPAVAQSVPAPSVPEIALRFVDTPYIVNSTDYSTGQTETRQASSRHIEVVIKNQPLNYANSSYNVYYNVRYKPNFDTSGWWMQCGIMNVKSSPPDKTGVQSYASYLPGTAIKQSSGEETTVTFALAAGGEGYDVGYYGNAGQEMLGFSFPLDGKVDFQVQALVGHDSQFWAHFINTYSEPSEGDGFVSGVAYDSSSGWSNTQTLDLALYPTPEPSSVNSVDTSPAILGWSWLVIAVVIVVVLLAVAAFKARTVNSLR
jgi:hypothetical protein